MQLAEAREALDLLKAACVTSFSPATYGMFVAPLEVVAVDDTSVSLAAFRIVWERLRNPKQSPGAEFLAALALHFGERALVLVEPPPTPLVVQRSRAVAIDRALVDPEHDDLPALLIDSCRITRTVDHVDVLSNAKMLPISFRPVLKPYSFTDPRGQVTRVEPSRIGAATVNDYDIIIYALSAVNAVYNPEKRGYVFQVRAADFFRFTKRGDSKSSYASLANALMRLRGTYLLTEIPDRTGKTYTQSFGIIYDYGILRGEDDAPLEFTFLVPEWIYRAATENYVLALTKDYFTFDPVEKRLYRYAVRRLGSQKTFRISLQRLHEQCPLGSVLRKTRAALLRLSRAPLGGIAIAIEDDMVTFRPVEESGVLAALPSGEAESPKTLIPQKH